jgi:hypothetical protein
VTGDEEDVTLEMSSWGISASVVLQEERPRLTAAAI